MKKSELSALLHSLGIPVDEGICAKENYNTYPKIIYWPYIEEDVLASGKEGVRERIRKQSDVSNIILVKIPST